MKDTLVGTWNTGWTGGDHPPATLTINQDGTGEYTWKSGKISGKFDTAEESISGAWKQENGSGRFTFVLTSPLTFSGVWTNEKGLPGGYWNGTKAA